MTKFSGAPRASAKETDREMLRPASVSVAPYIIAGLVLILTGFGAIGTWAAVAPLSGAVIATGIVTVDSKRKSIQHLEGGIVSRIFVRDGDSVDQGALLIRLDDVRAKAGLAIIEGQLDLLQARLARLLAERDGAEEVVFPYSLTQRQDDPPVQDIMTGQREQFEARGAAQQGEFDILTSRIKQFREEIRGLKAQQKSKRRQIEIIQQELEGLRSLYEKGYATLPRILALEREAEQLDGERGQHISDIARAKSGIGEAELQVIQTQKTFREEVVAELREVQSEIFDLSERRIAAQDELRRVDIRSPIAGTIVGMEVHTIGGVIAPGQTVLNVVPKDDELVIEGQVQPEDIDKITLGQEAIVRLSAFNLRTTPELKGTVIVVSADSFSDEATGQSFYLMRIRIAEAELAKLGGLVLVPGMPVESFINTGERTALSFLLKPLSDSLARAFKED